MPAMLSIQRREWWFPLLLALFFVVAGSLPYAYGYRAAGPDEAFMGFIGRGTPGANSYFAFARQVEEGRTLTTNLYKSQGPSQAYFNFEWWCMGTAARLTGLPLIAWFHIGRGLSVFAFLLAAYYFCASFLPDVRHRRAALALIALGAGFGWLIAGVNTLLGLSIDSTMDARGVTVFGYLINKPHFIRAGAVAALQYAWMIRGDATGRRRYFLLSGLAASGHSLVRPYHIPEACLVLALYFVARVWQDRERLSLHFGNVIAAAMGHAPAIAWQAWIFLANPLGLDAMDAWQPFLLLALVGWFGLPLAAVSVHLAVKVVRGRAWSPELSVPVLWLLAAALMLQAYPWFPWGVESYFPWVFVPPLLFLHHTWPVLSGWAATASRRKLLIAAVLIAVLPTNGLVYAKFFTTLHQPEGAWRYYLPHETLDAIAWLHENAPDEATVLASHDTSQFIPRFANLRTVTGQDALTPHYRFVNGHVLRFFQGGGDDGFKQWFLKEQHVAYVFVGPAERAIGGVDFDQYPWLERVYRAKDVAIYVVK